MMLWQFLDQLKSCLHSLNQSDLAGIYVEVDVEAHANVSRNSSDGSGWIARAPRQ